MNKNEKIYVYQIKHKYLKAKDKKLYGGMKRIVDYKFMPYQVDDVIDNKVVNENVEEVYAIHVNVSKDSQPVKFIIKRLESLYNNEFFDEADRKEMTDAGLNFISIGGCGGKEHYVLMPNEDNYNEFCKAQLCFSTSGIVKNVLFLNAADQTEFYSAELLKETLPDIINTLEQAGVIYKKLCPKKAKKAKEKKPATVEDDEADKEEVLDA